MKKILLALSVALFSVMCVRESYSRVPDDEPLLSKRDWEAMYSDPGSEYVHLDAGRMKRLIALPDVSEAVLELKAWLADGHRVARKDLVDRALGDAVKHYADQGDLEQQRRFEQYSEIVNHD